MAMRPKDVLGRDGEQAAAEYLERSGLRILARNWRCSEGEIDIVAAERRVLVVCEVKTRSGTRYGTPLESISRAKQLARNRSRRGRALRAATRRSACIHDLAGRNGIDEDPPSRVVDGELAREVDHAAVADSDSRQVAALVAGRKLLAA